MMTYSKASTILCAILLAFSACGDDDGSRSTEPKPVSTSINKIMPLGASRVEGDRRAYESFRYPLWKTLRESGWTFDLIGTQSDRGSYPDFQGVAFDTDHEGRGGWTTGQILDGLEGWLRQTGPPDVVLFSTPGGNDILQSQDYDQTVSNINAIIALLQTDNPDITIFMEQPAPGRSDFMTPAYTEAFRRLREDVQAIAGQKTTARSQVVAVDMYTGFNDGYLADDVHYNEAGAAFIAMRYHAALEKVLER